MLLYKLVRRNHETYPLRTFTAEFKAEAIKLVTEQKLTHAEVSQKSDIAIQTKPGSGLSLLHLIFMLF